MDSDSLVETFKDYTYHEECFMICNLLYCIIRICWSVYWVYENSRYK